MVVGRHTTFLSSGSFCTLAIVGGRATLLSSWSGSHSLDLALLVGDNLIGFVELCLEVFCFTLGFLACILLRLESFSVLSVELFDGLVVLLIEVSNGLLVSFVQFLLTVSDSFLTLSLGVVNLSLKGLNLFLSSSLFSGMLLKSLVECVEHFGYEMCAFLGLYQFLYTASGGNVFVLFHTVVIIWG